MRLTTESIDGVPVARLAGELDKLAVDEARVALDSMLTQGRLVVDLSELTFIDSAGLHTLFELAGKAASQGTSIAVCLPETSPIHRVVAVVRLATVMPVLPSVEAAADAVQVS